MMVMITTMNLHIFAELTYSIQENVLWSVLIWIQQIVFDLPPNQFNGHQFVITRRFWVWNWNLSDFFFFNFQNQSFRTKMWHSNSCNVMLCIRTALSFECRNIAKLKLEWKIGQWERKLCDKKCEKNSM